MSAENIELIIKKSGQFQVGTEEFNQIYHQFLKEFYQLPCLYIILSKDRFSEKTMRSVPLVSTKDRNIPTLYVFTSYSLAKNWCDYYNYKIGEKPLIGALLKDDLDYQSLYKIAYCMGVKSVMVNEGGQFFNFPIEAFREFNQIFDKIQISLTEEENKNLTKDEKPQVRFSSIALLDEGNTPENKSKKTQYILVYSS